MPPLIRTADGIAKCRLPGVSRNPRAFASAHTCLCQMQIQHHQQRRGKTSLVEEHSGQKDHTPIFHSPFKSKEDNPTTRIPSFKAYMSNRGQTSNKTFQYFMAGGMGLLAAAGAKATVQGE